MEVGQKQGFQVSLSTKYRLFGLGETSEPFPSFRLPRPMKNNFIQKAAFYFNS
jgi:hypothetical protein